MELASIILQDPNLTAKLLKVSNSSYYNPSKQKMSTVSRAIVILGSKTVRELTIACSFFEAIISPENKHRANQEIAQAIHAAVQAKDLAIACNDISPEEVFIAALLNNIGSIAFWCFGDKQCKYITELIQSGNYSHEQAEQKVLGFSLSELGKGISRTWSLGGLIDETINTPDSDNPRITTVKLGKEITHAIQNGWDSEEMVECIAKLESLTHQQASVIKEKLKDNTESAVKIACKFGAHDASQFIQSNRPLKTITAPSNEIIDKKQIQFDILQDITAHISGTIDLNHLFEMIVEGIHRGIGMDRTVFCLLSQNKKNLSEKLALGWLKNISHQKINFEISDFPANLFFKAIHSEKGLWANPKVDNDLFTPYVINTIGHSECFLLPIQVDNNPIGLIYADCSINNKPLVEDDFKVARHFAQQAIIGLALYKMKKQ